MSKLNQTQTFSLQTEEECAPCSLGVHGLTSMTAAGSEEPTGVGHVRWEGCIGVEGEMTGDGRLINKGALRWDDTLPAPLRYVAKDVGAHDGASTVGDIQEIERLADGRLWGSGDIHLDSVDGQEAARVIGKESANGVSMDLDDVSFEIRVAADLLDESEAMMEEMLAEPEEEGESTEEEDKPEREEDENGLVTVAEVPSNQEVMVTTDGRMRGATLVAIPAFNSARITLAEGTEDLDPEDAKDEATGEEDPEESLVASGKRVKNMDGPPTAWFQNPMFSEVTPLTVTDEGQIYGHLAAWGTCHISHTSDGQCITPPESNSGYSQFHLNPLKTAEGTDIGVGKLTVDAMHAGEKLNARNTAKHYDNTGSTAAFVRAGEDSHGIWVAGAVSPDATPKQLRTLKSSPLSGDWRRTGGSALELVAVLSVNVPGFAIPRPSGLVASGHLQSLVASGMVPPKRVAKPGTEGALSSSDLKYLKMLASRERDAQTRAKGETLSSRVAEAKAKVAPVPVTPREKVEAFAASRKKGK